MVWERGDPAPEKGWEEASLMAETGREAGVTVWSMAASGRKQCLFELAWQLPVCQGISHKFLSGCFWYGMG